MSYELGSVIVQFQLQGFFKVQLESFFGFWKMKGRNDDSQKKPLITVLFATAIFLGFLYLYNGSIFGSSRHGASSLRILGSSYLGGDEDSDGKQDDAVDIYSSDDGVITKSFPVCAFRVFLLDKRTCIY